MNLLENKSEWTTVRAKGRTRFILLRGALGWGATTTLVSLAVMWAIAPRDFSAWPWALVATIVFPLVGAGWGWFMWRYMERRHDDSRTCS